MEIKESDALARAVRGLSYAVWCLCALLVVMLSMPLWTFLFYNSSHRGEITTVPADSNPSPMIESGFDNDFSERPLADKLERATIILTVKRDRSGDRHRAIISEILKQEDGVRFYYRVGDEFEALSHAPRENCVGCEGDADLVFLTGNPARMTASYPVAGDRVLGLGDLTLAELRERVRPRPAMP